MPNILNPTTPGFRPDPDDTVTAVQPTKPEIPNPTRPSETIQHELEKMYEEQISKSTGKFKKDGEEYSTIPNNGVNDVPIMNLSDEQIKSFVEALSANIKGRDYTPLRYEDNYGKHSGNSRSFEHRIDFDSRYRLRIGDSEFYIPPEYISVSETSQTKKEPSIRSTSTLKKKYGYSSTDIAIRIFFNGDEQINGYPIDSPFEDKKYYVDGLRPFLAQCRMNPIMPVENEFLNRGANVYGLVIQNIQVKTVPNFPRLLECTILASEFDCSIYTLCPNWEFTNLIEWDFYRYNYQRLLGDYAPKEIAKEINPNYKLPNVKSFVMDKTLAFYIPDYDDLKILESNNSNVELDVSKLRYRRLLDNHNDDYITTVMSFGFENITITPKLSNFTKPTVQYLGGGDGIISLNIVTKNKYTVGAFKRLIEKSQYIIKKIKSCSGVGFVKVQNDFLNLVGTKFMLIDSVTIETVPNFPELYSINIQASSNDLLSNSTEKLEGFRPFYGGRDGTKDDCISQDAKGLLNKIIQDNYAEYNMSNIDLYPDLFLPTYDEVDYAIKKINEFRKRKGIPKIPLDEYPRRVSKTTLFGSPLAMQVSVDPDYYYMYPYLNLRSAILMSKSKDKKKFDSKDLVASTYVATASVNHVYKNEIKSVTSNNSGGIGSGPVDSLVNVAGAKATTCAALGIKCVREIDRVFLDYLLAKNGCAYVFGANGQFVYAKNDPRWTQENENRLYAHGGPVLDQWRNGSQAFDCSGLVGYGMYRVGFFSSIPRQNHLSFKPYCTSISKSEIRPGDILIGPGHIAVALGGDSTIEAMNSKKGVKIGNVGNRFDWFGRLKWTPELLEQYRNSGPSTGSGNSQTGFSLNRTIRMPSISRPDEVGGEANGPSTTGTILGKFGGSYDTYDSLILEKSKKYNVNPNWVKALMKQESGMNPTAKSGAPAYGLMQITSICAQHHKVPATTSYLYVPENNVDVGAKHLAEMLRDFGNYPDAVGAYNCGGGYYRSYLNGNRNLPQETINHIKKIQINYDTLIANGGTPVNGENGTGGNTSGGNGIIQETKTEYVEKKHGDKRAEIIGNFGLPIIIDSPANRLIDLEKALGVLEVSGTTIGQIQKELERSRNIYKDLNDIATKIKEQQKTVNDKLGLSSIKGNESTPSSTSKHNFHKMVELSTDRENFLEIMGSTVDECSFCSRGTMLRAFPTYSFVMTSDSTQWFDGRKLWTNFYPYKAITGITVTHDHEQPMGTAHIRCTNFSQNLTRKPKVTYKSIAEDPEYMDGLFEKVCKERFGYEGDWKGVKEIMYKHFGFIVGTPKITDSIIDSYNKVHSQIKLQTGTRVHIRMGYGNSFHLLPVVFNGTIAEINTDDFVEIVAQSDGAELINTVVSSDPKKTNGLSKLQQEPSNIITSLLIDRGSWTHIIDKAWGEKSEYSIEHFGLYMGRNGGGIFNNRELEYDLTKNVYLGTYAQSLYSSQHTINVFDGEEGVEFFLYNKTPWDVANITTQTLPEFVCYPRYHQFDSRLFFGVPSWLYKYRYDIGEDKKVVEYAKSFSQLHLINVNDIIDNRVKASSKFLHTNAICSYVLGNNAQNDVECTPTMFADKSIDWAMQKTKVIDTSLQQNYIGPDGVWEFFGFNEGVTNAESVAVTSLLESFSKMYYDEIICLGNSSINPYDEIFIDDIYAEMYGLARVNRVVHSFTAETGFTTSITPGLISYSKSEDSGSTNTYRNKVNLMDYAATILSSRYMSLESINVYSNSIYDLSKDRDFDFRGILMESLANFKPITDAEEFVKELKVNAESIEDKEKREAIKNLVEHQYVSTKSDSQFKRELTNWFIRVPLWRSVAGFFGNGNCVGIRPLLHKARPFVAGIKGSKDLIDGFTDEPVTEEDIDE